MTPARFDRLLKRHGGDLRRWPPRLQAQAQALLASGLPQSVQVRLDAMRALEARFARDRATRAEAPPPSPAITLAALARIRAARAPTPAIGPWRRYATGAAFASAALAGLAAGFILTPPDAAGGSVSAISLLLGGPEALL